MDYTAENLAGHMTTLTLIHDREHDEENLDGPEALQDLFFDDLFPIMAIPFVKYNQNTVIPFPIKYLTEWYKKEHPEWRD